MERRKSPEEKIQAQFNKRALKVAETLVGWYCETGQLPKLQTSYIWRDSTDDSWDNGGWMLRITSPDLGEVERPMK